MVGRERRKTRDKEYKSNLGGGKRGKEKQVKKRAKMKKLKEGNKRKPCTVDS